MWVLTGAISMRREQSVLHHTNVERCKGGSDAIEEVRRAIIWSIEQRAAEKDGKQS